MYWSYGPGQQCSRVSPQYCQCSTGTNQCECWQGRRDGAGSTAVFCVFRAWTILLSFQRCCYLRTEKEAPQNWEEHRPESCDDIYHIIGLRISQRHIDGQQVLLTELTSYTPAMCHADGSIRLSTGKSTLKKHSYKLKSPSTLEYFTNSCTCGSGCICCALGSHMRSAWKCWCIHASRHDINSKQLQKCDIYLSSDHYLHFSMNISTRATGDNYLNSSTTAQIPYWNREAVLKTSPNKAQLNALISKEIVNICLSTIIDEHTFAKNNLTAETYTYKYILRTKILIMMTQSNFGCSLWGSQFFGICNSARVL